MSKNIVFIPYIKRNQSLGDEGVQKPRWDKGYEYGINSWKIWCKQNNCTLFIMDELMTSEDEMLITWQRWNALNILDHNKIKYNQVLVVDADSVVHPNCPNFFDLTNNKFSSVVTNGCYEWVNRAIKGYSQEFFNERMCVRPWEFFQTGFVIINYQHKKFFDKVFKYYWKNKEKIIKSYSVIKTGSDIVLLNILRKKFNLDLNLLPDQFALMDMTRKNLLYFDPRTQWWEDSIQNVLDSGWIYQFSSIPKQNYLNRNREYWMERIHNELYDKI
jgi:hypothetical protein